jgi:hypothetical protein
MDQAHSEMRSSQTCSGGLSSSESWQQHEHLSAQLELDALRLLADAGTPELAKFAIDSVEQQQHDQLRTEFAEALGFSSYRDLLAASAGIATADEKLWFVTPLADGQWIGWNFFEITANVKHATREAAIAHVEQSVTANWPR